MSRDDLDGVFSAFLRDRWKTGLFLLACMGVFALFSALFGLPLSGVTYACVLCFFFGMLTVGVDFSRYLRRHVQLRRLLHAALSDAAALPAPRGLIEDDYHALLCLALENSAAAAEKAESAGRAQRDYYSLWAHQIKVPISAMRLLLQSQQSGQAAQLGAELFKIEQYVDMALNYVRLNGDSTDYVLKTCPLCDIVRQAVRKFAPLFIQKKLKLNYHDTSLMVLTDEKWLVFALEQLLSNAVKYTRRGSVTIRADEASQSLIVEDTGIGIAPEDLPRVFEQGYTGYNGRGDKRATGLGLYLCKQVLTRLGHTISIQSEPGRGTRATVGLEHIQTCLE